jgi:hypothetical protein
MRLARRRRVLPRLAWPWPERHRQTTHRKPSRGSGGAARAVCGAAARCEVRLRCRLLRQLCIVLQLLFRFCIRLPAAAPQQAALAPSGSQPAATDGIGALAWPLRWRLCAPRIPALVAAAVRVACSQAPAPRRLGLLAAHSPSRRPSLSALSELSLAPHRISSRSARAPALGLQLFSLSLTAQPSGECCARVWLASRRVAREREMGEGGMQRECKAQRQGRGRDRKNAPLTTRRRPGRQRGVKHDKGAAGGRASARSLRRGAAGRLWLRIGQSCSHESAALLAGGQCTMRQRRAAARHRLVDAREARAASA